MKYCFHCMKLIDDNEIFCHHCGKVVEKEVPVHHIKPGSVLNNNFLVGSAIGEGGFGITYVGLDLTLDIKVAIKEYYPSDIANRNSEVSQSISYSIDSEFTDGMEKFLLEARTLAKFSGDANVVTVREFFESNNTAYIVMEYVDGITLKEFIREKGCIEAEKVFGLLKPIMKSLGNIHSQELIHRDISPDNIMLVDNRAKLIDFGAARNMSSAASKSLSIMLKHGYAPEEQYRTRGNQGPWTDIYALCATMYHCITGKKPDEATQRIYEDELMKPSQLGVKIDENLENVLMKGLQVFQKDRYQNIDEMLRDIESGKIKTVMPSQIGINEKECTVRIKNKPSDILDAVEINKPAKTESNEKNTVSPKRKKNLILPIIIAIIVVVAVVLIIVLPKGKKDSTDSETTKVEQITTEEETTASGGILYKAPKEESETTSDKNKLLP